ARRDHGRGHDRLPRRPHRLAGRQRQPDHPLGARAELPRGRGPAPVRAHHGGPRALRHPPAGEHGGAGRGRQHLGGGELRPLTTADTAIAKPAKLTSKQLPKATPWVVAAASIVLAAVISLSAFGGFNIPVVAILAGL